MNINTNINTITAYLLVSNTDAVELKQQLRSFDASEDMRKAQLFLFLQKILP